MIIDVKSFIGDSNRNNAPSYTGGRPLINSYNTHQTMYINQQPESYSKVLDYIKKSPETLAVFNAIATDITSDGVYFTPVQKTGGDTKIKAAQDFIRANSWRSQFKGGIIDWLMLGNCAWWIGLSENEGKEFIKEKLGINYKGDFYDEQFNEFRKFQTVPWSTMYILHDSENINGYKQVVGTGDSELVDQYGKPLEDTTRSSVGHTTRIWKPDAIIHAKFMSFDGKVYGYTPTFSLLPVISTQQLLKDYLGNYFQNGGVPDWMFILPGEMANSPNVSRLEQMLQEYTSTSQKHGNMVIPGDVKTEAINKFDKDMEFRSLAVYYTAVLAFAFNMPMGRLQSILGLENKAKESDIAAESYWRTISEAQDYFEDLFNTQLFIPYFGVELHFNKTYKQDQIRESQNYLFLADYASKMDNLLWRAGKKKLSENYLRRIFQLEASDMETTTEEPIAESGARQGFMDNNTLTGSNQQNRNEKKASAQKSQEKKRV